MEKKMEKKMELTRADYEDIAWLVLQREIELKKWLSEVSPEDKWYGKYQEQLELNELLYAKVYAAKLLVE